ncbi:MAG: divergent PAP2 family protein [Candidatus Margulisiibacteriota bacterium]|mgnify:CR=1 FL=1
MLEWLSGFYPLISALTGMVVAQGLKTVYFYYRDRKLHLKYIFMSGGMPSSHSSLVSALTTAIAIKDGLASSAFCISLIFSIIVIYDSGGVRHITGKQAQLINQIIEQLCTSQFSPKKLSESWGHTPVEVAVGVGLGIVCAVVLAVIL